MPKEQRTFTKEFKVEAVHLVQTSEKSQVQVARDIDTVPYGVCDVMPNYRAEVLVGSLQVPDVNYLRICLNWGGFPGLAKECRLLPDELAFLTKDLLPF